MISTQATLLCGEACSRPLTAPWSTYVKRKTRGIQSQVAPSLGRSCQCEVRIKTISGEPRMVVTCSNIDNAVEEMFNIICTELYCTCIKHLNNTLPSGLGFVLFLIILINNFVLFLINFNLIKPFRKDYYIFFKHANL